MASEHLYFYEDEVFRLNKKGNLELGMVLQNSEHFSTDDEDDEYDGNVRNGYIRVAWHPSGVEEILPEKRVGLADRSLMPGDVVRRLIKGRDTQRGYCRNINVKAVLQVVGTKQIIVDVNSRDLKPVEKFMPGIVVVLNSWVGTVKTVSSRLHLSLADGSRCVINDADAEELEEYDARRGEADFPHRNDFHPGQVLLGTPQDLVSAKWISGNKDIKTRANKTLRMLVEEVETESVVVHWQCYAYSVNLDPITQPDSEVRGPDLKNLKALNVFESCTLQIGDRSLYVLRDNDQVVAKDMWRYRQEWQLFSRKNHWKRKVTDNGKLKAEDDNKCKTPEVPENDQQKPGNEGWETDDGDSASVSSGCSSNSSAGGGGGQVRKRKNAGLMTKMLKYKKLRRTRRRPANVSLKPNSQLVVETVMTSSAADVVWQDGSVEVGIPSTQLYPIHHLDDQEFFPGDFVVENKENGCMRVYGVVQSVDHVGRLANVTWFHTYTSHQETEPKKLDTIEVSVYDLKDHPDFQYRPGTVALRVANFEDDNEACTVGQVLDNYPEGRVHMWWVDGNTSMCWPQDLYKVGDYDSDEGELWDDNGSEGSWETESEEELLDDTIKPKLAGTIERARVSMSRLEELFTQNPSVQTVSTMQKLLEFYRDCRYLDKLMGSSYFHERHFQGLVEHVRERNRSTMVGQRMQDQISRLSAPIPCNDSNNTTCNETPTQNKTLFEYPNSGADLDRVTAALENLNITLEENLSRSKSASEDDEKSPNSLNGGPLVQSSSQDDSGVFEHSAVSADASSSENCDCLAKESSVTESRKGTYIFGALGSRVSWGCEKRPGPRSNKHPTAAVPPGHQQTDQSDTNPCAKLCSLIKAQLCLALGEIFQRFHGGNAPRLSDVEKTSLEEDVLSPPPTPSTEDSPPLSNVDDGGFEVSSSASPSHKFRLTICQAPDPIFLKTVRKELSLLRNALPGGIWVRGYEDRMDLYSMMIRGPEKTPYEDGLFLFDVQLPPDYPRAPPLFHYHSYCSDRLNPNLYEDGKVCVSLLGTWKGRGTEVWSMNSTLLQVIVSIQGLILVKEPYYNEAGYEKQKGSQQGHENSRMYNEMAILKLVQAMTKLCVYPHPDFKNEIKDHFSRNAQRLIRRLEKWLDISEKYNHDVPPSPVTSCAEIDAAERHQQWERSEINTSSAAYQPDFPLLPASRGFCITMRKTLEGFRAAVATDS